MARNYQKERYDRMRALGLCHRKGPKGNWAWVDPKNPIWPKPKPKQAPPTQPKASSLVPVPEYSVFVLKRAPFTVYRKNNDGLYLPLKFQMRGGAECYTYGGGVPCVRRATVIALALVGPRPAGAHQIRFRDGNKLNCNPKNIYWFVRDPGSATKYYAEFRERNVFLQFGKAGTPGAGQRWTQRSIAEKLMKVKPEFRKWKPEYAPIPPTGVHHPRKKKD